MKNLTLIILCLATITIGYSQQSNLVIQWQKCLGYGYQTNDQGLPQNGNVYPFKTGASIVKTTDNCYVVFENLYTDDVKVNKLSANGTLIWSNTFGGSNSDIAKEIIQTSDGGYIFVGTSNSTDLVGATNYGGTDVWVVKMNSLGILQWQKNISTTSNTDDDIGSSITETSDNGFVVAGYSVSLMPQNNGSSDFYVVKINSVGATQVLRCFGSYAAEDCSKIQKCADGGFILIGATRVGLAGPNGDVGIANNYSDVWIVKLNASLNIVWQKCFGSSSYDGSFTTPSSPSSIIQTSDLGFLFLTFTRGNNGDVTFNNGLADIWVVKISATGTLEWQKSLGGSGAEYGFSIKQVNNDYLIIGNTYSNNGDVEGNHTPGPSGMKSDIWIAKINAIGNLIWQKCLGGTNNDYGVEIIANTDGSIIVSGNTKSNDGDVVGNTFNESVWVVKLFECNATTATSSTINKTACGSYLSPAGNTYTISGIYNDTIPNHNGCDSLITINLTVNQVINPLFSQIDALCNGSNFTTLPTSSTNGIVGAWSPQPNNNQTTNYIFTPTSGQCASNSTMLITVLPNTSSQITQTANNTYTLNGQTYSQSGTYTQVIPNANGCDSTITLNLTINTTGLNELTNSKFYIYPNPANNLIHIDYEGNIEILEIIDAKGAVVFVSKESLKEYLLPTYLQSGYYIVNIYSDSQFPIRKELLIQR